MHASKKRPGSPGLASSTRRRRANDQMKSHRMLRAITAAVVVVTTVTSSVTHTMLASDIMRSINERSRRLDWKDHCGDFDKRGSDCCRRQYRMPQQTFEMLADLLRSLLEVNQYFVDVSPASTRPPFSRTRLDEMTSCIQQCCTERECVLPSISHSPLTHSAV